MEDNEKTIEDLQARIAKTIKVLEGVKESDMVDAEGVEVIIKTRYGVPNPLDSFGSSLEKREESGGS